MNVSLCPVCDEANEAMIVWGRTSHFNCRYCGMWWSDKSEDVYEYDLEENVS